MLLQESMGVPQMNTISKSMLFALGLIVLQGVSNAQEGAWMVYEGGSGPGQGKHIVFVTGDEEYRSE